MRMSGQDQPLVVHPMETGQHVETRVVRVRKNEKIDTTDGVSGIIVVPMDVARGGLRLIQLTKRLGVNDGLPGLSSTKGLITEDVEETIIGGITFVGA